jgi:hypothetical protein
MELPQSRLKALVGEALDAQEDVPQAGAGSSLPQLPTSLGQASSVLSVRLVLAHLAQEARTALLLEAAWKRCYTWGGRASLQGESLLAE